jgi:hypothetical protein
MQYLPSTNPLKLKVGGNTAISSTVVADIIIELRINEALKSCYSFIKQMANHAKALKKSRLQLYVI